MNDIRGKKSEVNNIDPFRLLSHIVNNELLWFISINNIDRDDSQYYDHDPELAGELPES